MMSRSNSITYGVFIRDHDEWRQVSEHWLLPQAIDRACESHEILGAQIRVRSSTGVILMELAQRSQAFRFRKHSGSPDFLPVRPASATHAADNADHLR